MNIFSRPNRTPSPVPPQKFSRPPAATRPPAEWRQPWPQWIATLAAMFGLILTALAVMSGGINQLPSEIAHKAAIGVALTLGICFALEARVGLKNLVRADLLGIIALFYLTLYEFLFPQPYFDVMMPDAHLTQQAATAVLIAFGGLFLGRHLVWRGKQPFEAVMRWDPLESTCRHASLSIL